MHLGLLNFKGLLQICLNSDGTKNTECFLINTDLQLFYYHFDYATIAA